MYKKISSFILFILITLLCNYSFCQIKNKIEIQGVVIDNKTGETIPYASIRLFKFNNKELLTGCISDKEGVFNFYLNRPDTGIYHLWISYVGYTMKIIDLPIYTNKSNYNLNKITLTQSDIELNETIITSHRNKIESSVSKDIVIVDSSIINSSYNSMDLLSKIPQLKVDKINNNVTIIGRENVLVLINGILTNSNAELKTIQKEDIDRIEIISNPSAKYDSEYTGVINIILKKKFKQGITSNIDLSYYGLRHSEETITLSYGFNKLRIFANYSFNLRNHLLSSNEKRLLISDSVEFKYNKEYYSNKASEFWHIVHFGFDYFINNNNTLNITVNISPITEDKRATSKTNVYQNDSLTEYFNTDIFNSGNYLMQNYSVFYKLDFKNPENKITVDLNLYNMDFNSEVNYNHDYMIPIYSENIISRKLKQNDDKKSINLKIDYNQILYKNISFETGYNQYFWNYLNKTSENNAINLFNYFENRNAAYLNLFWKIKTIELITGLRFENTQITLNDTIKNKYLHIVPLFGIKHQINEYQTIRLNYKHNLRRPSFYSLNPFIYLQDSLNIRTGNPFLKPAEFNFYEIKYSFNKNDNYFSPTLYYRKGHYIFGNQITQIGNVRYIKNENISNSQKYGLQLNFSFKLFKHFKFNPFFELSYTKIIDNFITTQGNSIDFSLETEITLPKGFYLGIDLTRPGKIYYLQGYIKDDFTVDNIYLYKSIFKNNGMLAIGVTNPIGNMISYTFENFYNSEMNSIDKINFRMYFIKLSYSFTKGKELHSIERQYHMEKDK